MKWLSHMVGPIFTIGVGMTYYGIPEVIGYLLLGTLAAIAVFVLIFGFIFLVSWRPTKKKDNDDSP